ncbi:hypothetical protein [Yoonia sp.]|uniref:hypothetical protein n=1 Tax=Yoonia sp. TaxID=2212373 RepID=UPI00358EB558
MQRMSAYKLNTEDYFLEDFDGDFVLLNAKSGVYFEVSERAADFLRLILDGICPLKAIRALEKLNADAATAAKGFFQNLQIASIIGPQHDVPDGTDPSVAALQALSMPGNFVFEGCDDLSALILADPVHDVDLETGRLLWAADA